MRIHLSRMLIFGGIAIHLLAACAAVASQSAKPGEDSPKRAPGTRPAAGAKLAMGMNLAGIADWEPGFPFRNLMLGSRVWLTRNADGSGPFNTDLIEHIPVDANGYPLELPYTGPKVATPTIVTTLIPNRLKPGRYVLLYDGIGEFRQDLATRFVSVQPGRIVMEMTHNPAVGYEGFWITRSKRGDHVRNIRIVPIEDEKIDLAKHPFRADFLEFCKPFHVLRFMDWTATNGSLEKEWAGRKRPSFYTMIAETGDADGFFGAPPAPYKFRYSGGVAWEYVIQLCNTLKIDPWICVPHRATPSYVRSLAQLFKSKLDPKLKIHLEYSNEVWNWSFIQAHYMLRNREVGDVLESRGIQAWEDPAKTRGTSHPERMGELCVRTFKEFEKVFGNEMSRRVIRIVAAQNSWFDTVERTARYAVKYGGCDALSTGGYFGPDDTIYDRWDAAGAKLTGDQVIADMQSVMRGGWLETKRKEAGLARELKLKYFVYEGGQHIQPKNQAELPYMPALKAAQFHPKMESLYIDLFQHHVSAGTDLFCAFSSVGEQGTRWGSWGSAERYLQPLSETPKLRAILAANRPRAKE